MTDAPYTYRPNFPLVGARRNMSGDYEPVYIKENKTILGGIVKLREVPQFLGIGTSVKIDGFTEVTSDPQQAGQFRVNYITGRIYFHSDDEGKDITCEYYGLGSLVAIDEINYIWYLITKKFRFLSLFDTPESYEEANYKFLRVNKTGTGIIFDTPELGRSLSKFGIFYISGGEFVSFPGYSGEDVIKIYEVTLGDTVDATIESSTNYTEEVADATIQDSTTTYWTLDLNYTELEAKKGYYIECSDIIDTSDWNFIDKMYFDEEVTGDGKIRYLIKADDDYYGWSGSYFFKVNSFTGDSIQENGISNDVLSSLGAQHFEVFVGKKISFVVSLMTYKTDYTPVFKNKLTVEGWSGKTYTETDKIKATYFPTQNMWELENTTTDPLNIIAVLGSGRDDYCCNVEGFEFESLPPDTPVEIKANIQTTCQVMQEVEGDTLSEGIVLPTAPDQWEVIDNPYEFLFVEYNDTLALEFEECKNIEETGYNFISIFKFKGAKIQDDLGNYTPIINGTFAPVATPIGLGVTFKPKYSYFSVSATDNDRDIGLCWFWRNFNPETCFADAVGYLSSDRNSTGEMWQIYLNCLSYNIYEDYIAIFPYDYTKVSGGHAGANLANLCLYKNAQFGLADFIFLGIQQDPTKLNVIPWVYSKYTFYENLQEPADKLYTSYTYITDTSVYVGKTPRNISADLAMDVALVWVGEGVDNLSVIHYIQDRYNSLASYYSQVMRNYQKYKINPPLDLGDYSLDSLSPRNFSEDPYLNYNPNRYLVELDGILYKWDSTNSVFVEVSKDSTAEILYNAGNTIDEIRAIPQDAWHDKNPSTLSLWIIGYTDWKRAPVIPTKVDVNRTEVTADGWRVLKAGEECTVEWYPDRRIWRIKHHLPDSYTIKVLVAGLVNTEPKPTYFTELLDTPDSLDYPVPQILAAKNGRVTFIPYINPWAFLRP